MVLDAAGRGGGLGPTGDAGVVGTRDRFGPRGDVELREDRGEVVADGLAYPTNRSTGAASKANDQG